MKHIIYKHIYTHNRIDRKIYTELTMVIEICTSLKLKIFQNLSSEIDKALLTDFECNLYTSEITPSIKSVYSV